MLFDTLDGSDQDIRNRLTPTLSIREEAVQIRRFLPAMADYNWEKEKCRCVQMCCVDCRLIMYSMLIKDSN